MGSTHPSKSSATIEVSNVKLLPKANDRASMMNGRSGGAPLNVGFSSFNAAARRSRFSYGTEVAEVHVIGDAGAAEYRLRLPADDDELYAVRVEDVADALK